MTFFHDITHFICQFLHEKKNQSEIQMEEADKDNTFAYDIILRGQYPQDQCECDKMLD